MLERIIFPTLCSHAQMNRILFVGCDTYTEHYESFFEGREFITIDVDPRKARYGATRHVIDSVINLEAHFPAETLDAVICNGVIGWGLDEPREIQLAAGAVFSCLRRGGVFIVGWDDVPEQRPLVPEAPIESAEFVPFRLPPFSGSVYHAGTELRHVYNFYLKPGPDAPAEK